MGAAVTAIPLCGVDEDSGRPAEPLRDAQLARLNPIWAAIAENSTAVLSVAGD